MVGVKVNLFDINVKLELDNSGPVNLRKSLLFLANVSQNQYS